MAVKVGPFYNAANDYHVHVFASSGTFVPTFTGNVEVLVVAGGGGGGMDMGGGGGGGGVVHHTSYAVTAGSPITVTVGAGGAGAPSGTALDWVGTSAQSAGHQYTISATQGGNSTFGNITAVGGGYGGSSYFGYTPNNGYGSAGGSGGGASGYSDGSSGRGGAATANTVAGGTGYGNAGGGSTGQYYSGGGGGAGAAGTSGGTQNGGDGILNRILGVDYYWGGGGGGSAYSGSKGGNGGLGGGGGGGVGASTGGAGYNNGEPGGNDKYGGGAPGTYARSPGGRGGANTGGGGGGGSHYNSANYGGNGGSGIVIVRYPKSSGSYSISSTADGEYNKSSLILALDSTNVKSWGGIGSNRVASITTSFASWGGLVGSASTYNGIYGKGVSMVITNANGGGVRWWDSTNGNQPCSASTQYIVTAKIKYLNTPSVNLFYVRQFNSGGTQTSESGKFTTSNLVSLGGGWYQTWAIFTTDATAATFRVEGYDYANNAISIEDVQCKLYGWADLSGNGNDHLVAGSAPFTPGSFTLDGSTQGFTRSSALKGASANCTVTLWYKTSDTQELWVRGNGNNSIYLSASSGNNYYHAGVGSPTNYIDLVQVANPSAYRNNVWRMWEAKSVDFTSWTSFDWFLYPSAWQMAGTVSAIFVYNRVLTAAESAQNFYAFRNRFGI